MCLAVPDADSHVMCSTDMVLILVRLVVLIQILMGLVIHNMGPYTLCVPAGLPH